MQTEAAEAADLDPIPAREGVAHDLQDLFQRELDILRGQMFLLRRDDLDELGFGHVESSLPVGGRRMAAAPAGKTVPRQLRSPMCSLRRSPRLVPVGAPSEER